MTTAIAATVSIAKTETTAMIAAELPSESVSAVVSEGSVTIPVSGVASVCDASVSVSEDSSFASQSYSGGLSV